MHQRRPRNPSPSRRRPFQSSFYRFSLSSRTSPAFSSSTRQKSNSNLIFELNFLPPPSLLLPPSPTLPRWKLPLLAYQATLPRPRTPSPSFLPFLLYIRTLLIQHIQPSCSTSISRRTRSRSSPSRKEGSSYVQRKYGIVVGLVLSRRR